MQGCQLWDFGWSETLGLGGPSRLLTGGAGRDCWRGVGGVLVAIVDGGGGVLVAIVDGGGGGGEGGVFLFWRDISCVVRESVRLMVKAWVSRQERDCWQPCLCIRVECKWCNSCLACHFQHQYLLLAYNSLATKTVVGHAPPSSHETSPLPSPPPLSPPLSPPPAYLINLTHWRKCWNRAFFSGV